MKLSRMAWNNVFRNVKSTALVFASLFCGLSLFLLVTGLLYGLRPENYVSGWGVSDFALTYSIYENEDLISSEMVSEISQIDGIENLRLTYAPYPQVTADVLETGLSVILLLAGVMNFINTMVVNVSTRRYELAILESVGMTKRQIKRMLSMEECYYWGASFSLVVTIGTAIYIMLYVIFSKVASYAVFSYPFIPLAMVSGLVLLICLIVPIWAYKADIKLPVVVRLRISEKG